jgi:3-oxoacyl-[acyl-carrier-protein] synthase I
MTHPVSVVSCGARTAVGLVARTSAAALRAGICRLREHDFMVDRAGDPYVLACDPTLKATGRVDRLVALARAVIGEALAGVGQPLPRVPAFVAVTETLPAHAEPFARVVAGRLAPALAPLEVDLRIVPQGNAGGFAALKAGMALLELGRDPVCLVVGADSFVDADVLDVLDVQSRLACVRNRWGFPPGEAAAAVVLASVAAQRGHRLPLLGELRAVALAHEPNHMHTDTPCTGEGLSQAITEALRSSGTPGIALTLCDLDGERYRDREYTWATQRIPAGLPLDPTRYETLVPRCGAVGGATALLGMVTAACWAERGHHAESDILLWAGSELGARGAAVLRTGPSRMWS